MTPNTWESLIHEEAELEHTFDISDIWNVIHSFNSIIVDLLQDAGVHILTAVESATLLTTDEAEAPGSKPSSGAAPNSPQVQTEEKAADTEVLDSGVDMSMIPIGQPTIITDAQPSAQPSASEVSIIQTMADQLKTLMEGYVRETNTAQEMQYHAKKL